MSLTVNFLMRLPRDLADGLDRLAPRYGHTSRSALLRIAAQEFITKHDPTATSSDRG